MKIFRMISCIGCSVALSLVSFADSQHDERPSSNPSPDEVHKAMDRVPPITVYGKVLDQNGEPVSEVEVEIFWHTVKLGIGWGEDIVKSEWIKSGNDGCFRWTVVKGFAPSIQQLRKTGYDFTRDQTPYFNPRIGGDLMINSTSKGKPLLLYLRKKGDTTFLLERDTMRLDIKLDGASAHFADILPPPDQYELDMMAATKRQGTRQIGFDAKVEYLTNDVAYRLTFIAPEGGAVLLSDKILREAPEQGYESNVTVTISSKGNEKRLFLVKKPMWLFIRTAEPTVYARLAVDFDAVTPSIRFNTAINPYGERNFEAETELDYKGRKQLETDGRINMRQNKRPSKPDLPKLVKEAKEKADKSKQKSP